MPSRHFHFPAGVLGALQPSGLCVCMYVCACTYKCVCRVYMSQNFTDFTPFKRVFYSIPNGRRVHIRPIPTDPALFPNPYKY